LNKKIGIENKFLFAPVKCKKRSLIKLKEKISNLSDKLKENLSKDAIKFPLYSLKDLSRGSFVFKNSTQL
jgi:hypothetical protein